jgi:hypothetical protein
MQDSLLKIVYSAPIASVNMAEPKKLQDPQRPTGESYADILTSITEIRTNQKWHRNIGWTIAATYAAVFVAVIGWIMSSYIPDKFDDKLPKDLKENYGALSQKVLNLEDRLNRLTPTALNGLIPSQAVRDPKQLTEQLRQASAVIDVAFTAQIPGDPKSLDQLQMRVADIRKAQDKDSKVYAAATGTEVRLDGYQLSSARMLRGLNPRTEAFQNPDISSTTEFSYLMGFTMNCLHPVAHFLSVSGQDVTVFDVRVNTCAQKLEGIRWINDQFNGGAIEYNGGPLYLADVKFTNCTFKFGNDSNSKAVLSAIVASESSPVSIYLP